VEPQEQERRTQGHGSGKGIKSFSAEKGYGFISPLVGGEDVFVEDFSVRHSVAAAPGFGILYEGERVVYQAAWDEWGLKAENVCVILSSRPTDR
jgi:CspA family cold shock protein